VKAWWDNVKEELWLVFTHAVLASTGISCRCASLHLSQVSILLKWLNVWSLKQCHAIAQGLLVFCYRKSRQSSNGVTPNRGTKYRWSWLNAGAVAASWRLLMRSIVNLARSQVCHTERLTVQSPWCSALRGFVGDSWSLWFLLLGCMSLEQVEREKSRGSSLPKFAAENGD